MSAEIIPDILYKYYKPERWEDVFAKWTIRFSPCSDLNDPFEGMPAFEKTHSFQSREKLKKANSIIDDKFFKKFENDELAAKLATQLQRSHDVGIFCLTPKPGNMLMWAHYTDSHRGFVVGFDMRSDFFKFKNYSGQWLPRRVEYLTDRHVIKNLTDVTHEEFDAMIYTKGACWGYEKEYRMLCPLKNCTSIWAGEKEVRGIHAIPKSAINCIIFGACMDENKIEQCCNELGMQEKCSHIQKKKAVLSRKSYSLSIKKIL